ncbi:GNAT family N-acetyltransferase [Actibacterium sp. XHP0104]|uniref:GNAT family N-acetyltransferase n=1 Tax=Actibacterium sp. XHP0104 TaxID=2984335 RepID=UPI0021E85E00|nr:GNAT family N-acetyltransferase [Actibacterium sp. XHP0104]MCV2880785.1 GNAT family N-acetyltransferase [Actibacterium sp. XHP0104]
MPDLIIRPLHSSDRQAWARLWQGYLAYYETTLPDHIYESSFARMLSGAPNEFQGRLAILDGEPVGLVHFLFHRHGWKIENVCYLQDLYVDPAVRRAGVARALIEAVYAEADAAGAPGLYWLTQDFNKTARGLYDQVAKVTPFIKYQRS